MKRWTWLAMVVVLGASLTALAGPGRKGGQGGEEGPGWGHRGPGGPGAGVCLALRDPALGVTEQQADQLKPLCRAQRDKMRELGDSLDDLHDAVRAELEKDTPDFDRVGALHQQMATLKTDMARQHVALRGQARAILTPEQQAKLKQLREAGHPGKGHGHGPRGGHGCDGGMAPEDGADQPPRGDDR